MRRSILTLLIVAPSLTAGCTAGQIELARGKEIRGLNELIHDRAYRCAPTALAMSVSHTDFGMRELGQGDFLRARRHFDIAEQNGKRADVESRGEQCLPRAAPKPKASDKDGDGIVDKDDQCPLHPEDLDGFEDRDGCPELDNDKDRIADLEDSCPNVPEDYDGDADEDGCPDETSDRDGDGLADPVDRCPDEPEDKDGWKDDDGCPDPDNDADGLLDAVDKCPDDPEDKDGFQDDDGCPDTDNDDDGIVDLKDGCPDEAEDYDGDQDEDGCPDLYKLVVVTEGRIELKQKVHFSSGKATILQKSFPLLNEVAQVLLDRAKMSVEIQGHTDSRGGDKYNKRLSQDRADSVKRYLARQGVQASRMAATGFGESEPIEDNATKTGRAANRRVEFHIKDK